VKDANGNALGSLVGFVNPRNATVTIYKSGYFVNVNFVTGRFPVTQTWWSGANCTGTPRVNSGGAPDPSPAPALPYYTKSVVYLAKSNTLYVPTSNGTNPLLAEEVLITNPPSIENAGTLSGTSECTNYTTNFNSGGWALTAINAATVLGWTVTGNPLQLAAPLQLP
jgi:hypothetical protein